MKRYILLVFLVLILFSSCKKAPQVETALPKTENAETADEQSETDRNIQTEKEDVLQPETDNSQTADSVQEKPPTQDNTDKPAVELPACTLTLIKSDVGYASDEDCAVELRKILENGDYTDGYSEYTEGIRVYLDGKSECTYTVFECKPMQTVRVRSKEGEYRADVDTSLKISELIKRICSYSAELERKGVNDLSVYSTPDFAQKEDHEYVTELFEKGALLTRASFKSKNLTKLLNQVIFDTPRTQTGMEVYPAISVTVKQADGLYISGDLTCDSPFLVKGNNFAFLSEELAKSILNEIARQKTDRFPVNVTYYSDIFTSYGYSFTGDDSAKLKKLLGSLSYDRPQCHCSCSLVIDFTDIKQKDDSQFGGDYYVIFERDSNNIHVKKDDKTATLTKKQRDTLTDIMLRQLNDINQTGGSNIDYMFDFKRLELSVTKDGKTVTPDENALSTLGYIFTIVDYAGEECGCGENYAVINTTEGKYSFCTCDNPKITSECGTKRIDANTLEQLITVVDSIFNQVAQ